MEKFHAVGHVQQKFGRNGISNVNYMHRSYLFAREQGKSKGDAIVSEIVAAADRGIPSVDDVSLTIAHAVLEHRSSHKGNYNGWILDNKPVLKRKYKLTDDECAHDIFSTKEDRASHHIKGYSRIAYMLGQTEHLKLVLIAVARYTDSAHRMDHINSVKSNAIQGTELNKLWEKLVRQFRDFYVVITHSRSS
ncbi:putative phage HD domain protein [Salmonella phage SPFM15]|nr:putative phage HD domain protein [Salmonella phage SPFM5]VFR13349.1 putative phage HD domain protein [Salmonella phage SPFM14]VFR13645.1 putative phage HD domain protein [Salmonella phage SPFM15]